MSQQDYENGLKVRTEVMGESFVKRAQENTVSFTHHFSTDFQAIFIILL